MKPENRHSFTINSLGGLGDGIAEHKGKPVFVPKTCAGDEIDAYITKKNREGYTAQIETIITAGPERVEPPCPHYASCGGCSLQHINDTAYTAFKQRVLDNALAHAGFADAPRTLHTMPKATRRRVEFTVFHGKLSLHQLRSHRLTAIDACLMLRPELDAIIAPINAVLAQFSEIALQTVSLTLADNGVEILTKGEHTPSAAMAEALLDATGAARHAHEYRAKINTLAERVPLAMNIGNYSVALPSGAFLQPSSQGQATLTALVTQALQGSKKVVDLFCGLGTFGLCLPAEVDFFEGNAAAIASLSALGARAYVRDLFREPLPAATLSAYDAAIINPPRAGAEAQISELAASNISRIVMVSCNPATFSRDAKTLKNSGFTMTEAHGVDQFVGSAHLEICARFERPHA